MASTVRSAGQARPKNRRHLGYRSIYWTLDSLDGVEPLKTPQFLIDRITTKAMPSSMAQLF